MACGSTLRKHTALQLQVDKQIKKIMRRKKKNKKKTYCPLYWSLATQRIASQNKSFASHQIDCSKITKRPFPLHFCVSTIFLNNIFFFFFCFDAGIKVLHSVVFICLFLFSLFFYFCKSCAYVYVRALCLVANLLLLFLLRNVFVIWFYPSQMM